MLTGCFITKGEEGVEVQRKLMGSETVVSIPVLAVGAIVSTALLYKKQIVTTKYGEWRSGRVDKRDRIT